MEFNVSRFKYFFKEVTGFTPYEWQIDIAVKLASMDKGVLVLSAETGSGKTEAVLTPGLFLGRQVIIVEPYRAIIEDLEDRVKNYLINLSKKFNAIYSLGIDYGGEHEIYECCRDGCNRKESRKPFGADTILTTTDEMLYRLLSIGPERKASFYATLIRFGNPLVFFDEGHSYADDVGRVNPFVTFIHEVISLSLYVPVVVTSASIQEYLKEHLRHLANLNRVKYDCYEVKPRKKDVSKAVVEFFTQEGADVIASKVLELISSGFKSILVRVIRPETAFNVYSRLVKELYSKYCIGVLHGRMPTKDRANVFRSIRQDILSGEPLVLVATGVIEAGVDLDFDAGVVELMPYSNLIQTLGRVNRRYRKAGSRVVIVRSNDLDWSVVGGDMRYLNELVSRLANVGGVPWEEVSEVVAEIAKKYDKLTPNTLVDIYTDSYSRLISISLYSLFHLRGTLLEYLIGLSEDEYNTRGSLDILAEVEGEKGNYIRIPYSIAEELKIKEGKIPNNLLTPHNYIRRNEEEIRARGLIKHSQGKP